MNRETAVIDALERAPNLILPLVREVPDFVRKRRPAPGKWSLHEHACHLADVHGLFSGRLDTMMADPNPEIVPYDPKNDPPDRLLNMDLEDALGRFERDRANLVARLRGLSPSDWERTAIHPEYSRYSIFLMFRHLALHDLFHAYRLEDLALNPEWAKG